MRRVNFLLLVGLVLFVVGCGGSGSTDYVSQARAGTSVLRSTIERFNSASPTDVAGAAAACRASRDALQAESGLGSPPSSGRYQLVGTDLRQVFKLALAGFADCAAATRFDYLHMYRAASELDSANQWLTKAQTDDPRA